LNGTATSTRLHASSVNDGEETCEARWWRDALKDSENFRRDLSALMTADSSAVLMMLTTPKVSNVLKDFRNYGSTIVHTTVSTTQDDKLNALLSQPRRERTQDNNWVHL
jgi:hypothetical protein